MNRANVETKTTIYIYIIKYYHVLVACLKGRPVYIYIYSVVVLPSFLAAPSSQVNGDRTSSFTNNQNPQDMSFRPPNTISKVMTYMA